MPLAISPIGKTVSIVGMPQGDVKRRLESLGMAPGTLITPVADNGGNLILKIGASKIALNRGLAMRIHVKDSL